MDTRKIIESAFDELNRNYSVTQYDFSTDWLGKSKSYYGYLKSSGAQAGNEVLLAIWGEALRRKRDAEYLAGLSTKPVIRLSHKNRAEYYSNMANEVQGKLRDAALEN